MKFPENLAELTLETSRDTSEAYAALTFDYNPLHLDEAFAAATPFAKPIAHGTMALNLLLEAINRSVKAAMPPVRTRLDIRFSAPVKVGETIRTGGRRTGSREGEYEVWVRNAAGQDVLSGTLTIGAGDGR